MNNLRFAFVGVVGLGLITVGTGCSGTDFGEEPDFDAIEQRFAAPNGSLTGKNAAALFDRYSNNVKYQDQMNINGATSAGGASSSTRTSSLGPRALEALDFGSEGASSSSGFRCDDILNGERSGSCGCPNGGTFDYDFEDLEELTEANSGPIDIKLKTRFDACQIASSTIDGRQFVRLTTSRALGGTGSLGLSMSIVADFRFTKDGQTHSVDLVARMSDKQLEMSLAVDDGWVTVRASSTGGSSGTFVVRDRNGAWTCQVTSGHGTCTSDKGETRTF